METYENHGCSFTGRLAYINLTTRETKSLQLAKDVMKKYIGGRSLSSLLLTELTEKGTDPLGPDNALIILTGPATGTLVPGGTKYVVATKSPVSGGYCDSYSSGRFAIEIKTSGYDGVVIKGRAKEPVIIIIADSQIDILSAENLWGKDAFETETELKNQFGEAAGIACIGPAGEKLVKYACINSEYFRQAARGGVGAVMGSKNLKAIIAKGSNGIKCYDGNALMDMVLQYKEDVNTSAHANIRMKYGTPLSMNITNEIGMLPTKNFQDGVFPEATGIIDGDGFLKDFIKSRGCIGCMIACSKITKIKGGEFDGDIVEGPEYETMGLFGSNLCILNRGAIVRANILCDKLGLDTISTGNVIGFVMECYERGLITKDELNDLEMDFGNHKSALAMIEMIANRTGIGDILAEGVRFAAKSIGQQSNHFACHVKGLEFPAYEPRAGYGVALSYAINPRGACHRRAWPPKIESLGKIPPNTTKDKASIVKRMSDENCIFHTILACDFPYKMASIKISQVASYLKVLTGLDYSEEDLLTMADRTETVIRMYNLREGLTRKDDDLPPRTHLDELKSGPTKGMRIPVEDLEWMKDEYYSLRGWDNEGVPKPKTLLELEIALDQSIFEE